MRDPKPVKHPTQSRVPAVVVCVVAGAIAVSLIGVSLFVTSPAKPASSSGGGVVTAVTPTHLGPASGAHRTA
jgi:hypothetical protein